MAKKNKVLLRFLTDFSAALIGLALGVLCLHVFRGGLSLPLGGTDGLILISSTFTALLFSSFFDKFIGRIMRS